MSKIPFTISFGLATDILPPEAIIAFCADKDALKGDLLLKIGLLINMSLWAVYGLFVKLYPVIVFNCVACVFAAISLVRIILALKRRAALPPAEEPAPTDDETDAKAE